MGEFDFFIDEMPNKIEGQMGDVMLFRNSLGCGFLMGLA